MTAEERAERISAALEELAKAQDFNPEDIKVTDEGGIATVRYSGRLIVTINDAEARGLGLRREALGLQYAKLIQEKLALAREQHTSRYLWRDCHLRSDNHTGLRLAHMAGGRWGAMDRQGTRDFRGSAY